MGHPLKKMSGEYSKYGRPFTAGLAMVMLPLVKQIADRLMDRWLGPQQGSESVHSDTTNAVRQQGRAPSGSSRSGAPHSRW